MQHYNEIIDIKYDNSVTSSKKHCSYTIIIARIEDGKPKKYTYSGKSMNVDRRLHQSITKMLELYDIKELEPGDHISASIIAHENDAQCLEAEEHTIKTLSQQYDMMNTYHNKNKVRARHKQLSLPLFSMN